MRLMRLTAPRRTVAGLVAVLTAMAGLVFALGGVSAQAATLAKTGVAQPDGTYAVLQPLSLGDQEEVRAHALHDFKEYRAEWWDDNPPLPFVPQGQGFGTTLRDAAEQLGITREQYVDGVKWDSTLEAVAVQRLAENLVMDKLGLHDGISHDRLDGTNALEWRHKDHIVNENLAFGDYQANVIGANSGWENELEDFIAADGLWTPKTGHIWAMMNPAYTATAFAGSNDTGVGTYGDYAGDGELAPGLTGDVLVPVNVPDDKATLEQLQASGLQVVYADTLEPVTPAETETPAPTETEDPAPTETETETPAPVDPFVEVERSSYTPTDSKQGVQWLAGGLTPDEKAEAHLVTPNGEQMPFDIEIDDTNGYASGALTWANYDQDGNIIEDNLPFPEGEYTIVVTQGDKAAEAKFTVTADGSTAEPTDTATPEPTDTATPAPTETETPAPTETETPAPVEPFVVVEHPSYSQAESKQGVQWLAGGLTPGERAEAYLVLPNGERMSFDIEIDADGHASGTLTWATFDEDGNMIEDNLPFPAGEYTIVVVQGDKAVEAKFTVSADGAPADPDAPEGTDATDPAKPGNGKSGSGKGGNNGGLAETGAQDLSVLAGFAIVLTLAGAGVMLQRRYAK